MDNNNIDAVTTATLSLALDAASLKHQAIAANIANRNTPGYVPQKVDFAAQMQGVRQSLDASGMVDPAALAQVRLRVEPALDANGRPEPIRLDAQMADMAQNDVHYRALARALSKHLAIVALAASDGKR